ncbi:CPBP family intramembrane glutamic endopeptidase [Acidicapsa ligni]|uniref:CPBP family intramembrane glutamic endopeptidase n=1 Tax=Acidicapsa ligni TaxID=542300 RepID=UPI0021E09CDA|nr:CPBP family intramembrane glutamic endopeptidase [Acidicapsa ligni]
MFILGSLSVTWAGVETKIYQHKLQEQKSTPGSAATKLTSPEQEQKEMAEKLMTMAPSSALECIAWGGLCLLVGFSEEIIFRGYLQTQCIAFLRSMPAGVVIAALVFGSAHGYQGVRGICLITVFGALFGIIALLRRNLFPGMLAHAWHDFATGMLLAFLRSSHMLDRLPHA